MTSRRSLPRPGRAQPERWVRQTDFATTRPSVTWPTGWHGWASRTSCSPRGHAGLHRHHRPRGRRRGLRLGTDDHRGRGATGTARGAPTRRLAGVSRAASSPTVGARRVVVKVGSSSLADPARGRHRSPLASTPSWPRSERGATGGERRWCWSPAAPSRRHAPPWACTRRPQDLATQQAAASVGQGALMARYAEAFAARELVVGQVLLTADDMTRRAHYRNAQRTLYRLLELGVVPDRQRERHRGHRRAPVRRQRPAGGPGGAPGACRGADPAQRRRRALRRAATARGPG